MDGVLDDRQRWAVPLSLAVSFLANDGEEFVTLVPTLHKTLAALPSWVRVPSWCRRVDQRHVNVAIAMMGGLCAAAVVDGVRTRGRGRLYQDFQWVFGLHGFGHLAMAAVTRGYTTGSATSLPVVLPQLAYAVRALRAGGVPSTVKPLRALYVTGGWLAVSHATGALVSHVLRTRNHDRL